MADHSISGTQDRKADSEDRSLAIRTVTLEDIKGTIGLSPETGAIVQVFEVERENGGNKKLLSWISDCPVYIHTETRAKDDSEFIFMGTGAVDNRPVKFTLPASHLAEPRKFKAALINAFGAKNKVGKLSFEMVQEMSLNPKLMQRVEVPCWEGSVPFVPGLDLAENVEYKLSDMTPAAVYDGDIEVAKQCLRNLLGLHKYAPILVTAILGAPAYARWYPNDRFGMALWGLTGSLKTTMMQATMSVFGTGYADKASLLKNGTNNSTDVGIVEVCAGTGIMPRSYDNVKTVDQKDRERYVGLVHTVLEGREKLRGKKDGGIRESLVFLCTLIITGEIRPEEASTTARIVNLSWSRPDESMLTFVQKHVADMPVIGYHWLQFLAETDQMSDDFEESRRTKMGEFAAKHYVNPGRLATNYCLLKETFRLLCESPFGDVFRDYAEQFEEALNQVIEDQGALVSGETEVAKFLSGLNELIASNPRLIQGKDTHDLSSGNDVIGRPPKSIGKWVPEGIFLLPGETLAELEKARIFTQKPSVESLTTALKADGVLITSPDGKHLKVERRMNGVKVRGWLLSSTVVSLSPPDGDTKKDNSGDDVSTGSTVSTGNERNKFLVDFQGKN
ncbi:MAG: DUF927 domain-containing protein [Dehalococcoidales bacterium]|nr:DUF927 domain-containing protein [Dehalococcoidales bacterium]